MLFCEVLELSYFHQILFSHGSSHKFLQKLTPSPPHTHKKNIDASPNGDKEYDDDMVSKRQNGLQPLLEGLKGSKVVCLGGKGDYLLYMPNIYKYTYKNGLGI